jgi:hypothetical protein
MLMTSESPARLMAILSSKANGRKLLAQRAAAAICAVIVVVLAGCRAAPQPESRQTLSASTSVQTAKPTLSNTIPDVNDCGLTAYPVSRSTPEILADVPQPSGRSKNSNDLYGKVAMDPDGKITHLRVLQLAFPEAPKALRDRVNAEAIDSIKRSHYSPRIVDGKSLASCADLSVNIDMR